MKPCSAPGCLSPSKCRGMCSKHYQRWIKENPDDVARRPNYGSGRRVTPVGYVYRWEPSHPLAHADGYVAEHRKVAWDLGMLTDPGMIVHHRDGDKANNDPSNLEVLWQDDHMTGHAATDGVVNQYGAWVVNDPSCSVDGCQRPTHQSNLCSAHHSRLARHGDVMADIQVGDLGTVRRIARELRDA